MVIKCVGWSQGDTFDKFNSDDFDAVNLLAQWLCVSVFSWNDLLKCICFLQHKYLSFLFSLSIIGNVREMQTRIWQITRFGRDFGSQTALHEMLDLCLSIRVWPGLQHFTELDLLNWIETDKTCYWTLNTHKRKQWIHENWGQADLCHQSDLYRRRAVWSPQSFSVRFMCLSTYRWGHGWATIPAHTRDTCTRQKQTRSLYRECMSNSSWPLLYGSPANERENHMWHAIIISSGCKAALLSWRVVTLKGWSLQMQIAKYRIAKQINF